jgi:hypothetical protein
MSPSRSKVVLTTCLWDLHAHAESKLRRLTRVQQQLDDLDAASDPDERGVILRKILAELEEIVNITEKSRSVAIDARNEARKLQ